MSPATEQERIVVLESAVDTLNRDVAAIKSEITNDFAEIKKDIRDLRDTYGRRPTWGVSMVIAGLSFTTAASVSTLLTLLVQSA